jgi:PhnB protein
MQVQPYLSFEGRCEEAVQFYRTALGAEVTMLKRFKESPDPYKCSPGTEDKVMHVSFRVGDTILLASDGRCTGQPNFQGFSERLFASLADGGKAQMPLTKTFFSSRFGMVAERFGVPWMILVAP